MHINTHHNLRMQHRAIASYQNIEFLNDIQEDLVLPMLDALHAPGDCVSEGDRGARRAFQAVTLLGYHSIDRYIGVAV